MYHFVDSYPKASCRTWCSFVGRTEREREREREIAIELQRYTKDSQLYIYIDSPQIIYILLYLIEAHGSSHESFLMAVQV